LANWDESATFFESLGLYKKNGASFDRSIYNELWNALDRYRKDISGKRISIKNPRLNMSVLGSIIFK
jgi:hypothetical protein